MHLVKKNINETSINLNKLQKPIYLKKIQLASKIIIDAIKKKNKVFFCGNGGSASESQHFAAELVGRYLKNRKELPAISLNSDVAVMTALSNDFSYEKIFSKQLSAIGKKGDVLFALSTSGKSKNIIEVIKVAKNKNIKSILLTGQKKSRVSKITNLEINVPSNRVDRIQELHLVVGHNICEIVEKKFF